MKIGIPKEIKTLEGRVGLIPESCAGLVAAGHQVYVESGAGVLSGYPDTDFEAVGVNILPDAKALYGETELIVKVKEPVATDLEYLREDHLLFCFLHLAAYPELTRKLCDIGLTGVAFETVTDDQGRLPLLAPMSEIAGRLSTQIGTRLLHQPQGGKGILLGGAGGSEKGRVVVLGGGHAGGAAAILASCSGAEVIVFDRNPTRLEELSLQAANIQGRMADTGAIAEAVRSADLVIGAVLLPGLHAPRVVTEDMVKSMGAGSVIIDISIDQGGCIETIRPTDYQNPTYQLHEVTHFAVTNMPGAVPRTSSQALSAAITPYVHRLSQPDWDQSEDLKNGINIRGGKIDNPLIEQALNST